MTNQQIRDIIGLPAAAEQAAEECTELAHALLKYARAMRSESPTPVTVQEAWEKVVEEYGDVLNCTDIVGIRADLPGMHKKMYDKRQRLEQRLKGVKDGKVDA